MAADLFLLDVDTFEGVGSDLDPANFLGTVGYSRPAQYVIANGQVIAEDGVLKGVNESELVPQAKRKVASILDKAT